MAAAPYPPETSREERARLTQIANDWAIANGLSMRPPESVTPGGSDADGILAKHVPFTLFPSPFPEVCFRQAQSVQEAYNALYAKISQDEDFLGKIVHDVKGGDEFTSKLWAVHARVKEEGYSQHLSLGLFRSDYLVHQESPSGEAVGAPQIKQVEFNTIASSFGGLSTITSKLHRFLSTTEYPLLAKAPTHGEFNMPPNESTAGLGTGLRAAFDAYGPSELGLDRCIIFLIKGDETNVFDQRHLEYAVSSSGPPIPVFRLPFAEVSTRTVVADGPRRQLLYKLPSNPSKQFEVSVVYLRVGYDPNDYPAESYWESRFQLERSAAIKCPSVLTQVAGTKKVQQVLATPKVGSTKSELGRFVGEGSDTYTELWRTFTNIYPMDGSEAGLKARKLATDPELCKSYVLKPQREGGGNNFYRTKIPEHLKQLPDSAWSSYILMELITPPPLSNMILRNGKVEQGGVVCELGVYGTCLWDHKSSEIMHNKQAGYLLRTKGDKSEEGGVAAGFGCMDSVTLV